MIKTNNFSQKIGLEKLDGSTTVRFDPFYAVKPLPRRGSATKCKVIEEPNGRKRPYMTLKNGKGNTVFSVTARARHLRDVMWNLEGKTIEKVTWKMTSERDCYVTFKMTLPQPDATDNPIDMIELDTETTGLNPSFDEILQLAIVDGTGNVLWNKTYKPDHLQRWDEASAINHIWPYMVANCPSIKQDVPQIQKIFNRAKRIYAWNAPFDLAFLGNIGLKADLSKCFDTMTLYGMKYHGSKWCKLSKAAEEMHYTFFQHDALDDTKAALKMQLHVDGKDHINPANSVHQPVSQIPQSRQTPSMPVSDIYEAPKDYQQSNPVSHVAQSHLTIPTQFPNSHHTGHRNLGRGRNWIFHIPTAGFIIYSILMWILIAFDLFLLMGSLFTPPVFALSAPVTALLVYPVYLMFWGYRNR